ncbi:hypothetical protein PoB_005311100 [Plakobranchus ocellatus]|uniref:Uncharacterized protein n=1 Tax=Plakobranchus ocellatus TaxID=259542 RepID=A0AAV4BTT7_9GAST|nr:hypothetical protein PoB_005311100 [Plakobranchus ocellatus]
MIVLMKARQNKRTMTCCRGHNREENYKRKLEQKEKTGKIIYAKDEAYKNQGRKRSLNPSEWKRDVQKQLKYILVRHTSQPLKNKSQQKTISRSCGVSYALRSSSHFDDEARETIFKGHWRNRDKREQRHFYYNTLRTLVQYVNEWAQIEE